MPWRAADNWNFQERIRHNAYDKKSRKLLVPDLAILVYESNNHTCRGDEHPLEPPRINPSFRTSRRRLWLLYTVFALAAYSWFHWLFDPITGIGGGYLAVFFLCLPVCAAAIALGAHIGAGDFLPVGITILVSLAALPVPLFPFSNDEAYYLAKTMWASMGDYFIDPAMGIRTGYPPLFHIVLGKIVSVTGWAHHNVTKMSVIASFTVIVGGCWILWRREYGPRIAMLSLWIMGLALYGKQWAAHLLSSAANFSMAPAIIGWWLFARGSTVWEEVFGAFAIAIAICLWPVHAFSAAGVALLVLFRRGTARRVFVYAFTSVIALLSWWYLRISSGALETFTGAQLIPTEPLEFVVSRLAALISLGTVGHGFIVGTAGTLLTLALASLIFVGHGSNPGRQAPVPLWRLGLGLLIGALLAFVLMTLSAYGIRLLFVAAVTVAPLAALGLATLGERMRGKVALRPWIVYVGLGGAWLMPTMAATTVTALEWRKWCSNGRATTEFLASHTLPGDRIWAETEDFCEIALGHIPVFGMLGHRWPLYYGAPKPDAEKFGRAYESMLQAPSLAEWKKTATQFKIKWAVLRTGIDPTAQWQIDLRRSQKPDFSNGAWEVFTISQPATPTAY